MWQHKYTESLEAVQVTPELDPKWLYLSGQVAALCSVLDLQYKHRPCSKRQSFSHCTSAAEGAETVWRGPAIASVKTSARMMVGAGVAELEGQERWVRTLHGERQRHA